jgi:hypothetical protein
MLDRYGYFEEDGEIELDRGGRERSRDIRVFVVQPAPPGGEPDSRLISVNGKPPSADERKEDDERRDGDRVDTSREASEGRARRRQQTMEDLRRGLIVRIAGRAAIDGHETTLVTFEPRSGASLHSRAARFIRAMRGKLWVTAAGDIVRSEVELMDNVSVGWGLIARIWKGSWLHVRQQPQGGVWLPHEMTAEAQGRTLLFRTFRTRYAVRWWGYQRGAGPKAPDSPAPQALR